MKSSSSCILQVLVLAILCQLVQGVDNIYGKIVSCQGWVLNKLPELKNFIRYGGAYSLENVGVEFQQGKRATLTIYHDGEEHETVDLQEIETEAEMIQMMIGKGFRLKSEEEVAQIRQIGVDARRKEENERTERMEEQKRRLEEYMKQKKKAASGEL